MWACFALYLVSFSWFVPFSLFQRSIETNEGEKQVSERKRGKAGWGQNWQKRRREENKRMLRRVCRQRDDTRRSERKRKRCVVLDHTTEQMATPQREDYNRDITTLRLKSPLEDTRTGAHTHIYGGSVAKGKVFLFNIGIWEKPKHTSFFVISQEHELRSLFTKQSSRHYKIMHVVVL